MTMSMIPPIDVFVSKIHVVKVALYEMDLKREKKELMIKNTVLYVIQVFPIQVVVRLPGVVCSVVPTSMLL